MPGAELNERDLMAPPRFNTYQTILVRDAHTCPSMADKSVAISSLSNVDGVIVDRQDPRRCLAELVLRRENCSCFLHERTVHATSR